jgi:hypothetical protein
MLCCRVIQLPLQASHSADRPDDVLTVLAKSSSCYTSSLLQCWAPVRANNPGTCTFKPPVLISAIWKYNGTLPLTWATYHALAVLDVV